ncbi:MAG: hypothetical protein IID36_03485, partial [Planctomycetes bacterium]|nr:hypothetical protein [Planctomycetota bacterium]
MGSQFPFRGAYTGFVVVVASCLVSPFDGEAQAADEASNQDPSVARRIAADTKPESPPSIPRFECGYRSPAAWMDAVRSAVARGEIADPTTREIPPIAAGVRRGGPSGSVCLSRGHIFPFEDSQGLLLTDFSDGELVDLMVTAANDLMSVHGDNFDFIGYWVNFVPHHEIGTAFYKFIENDVMGIGDASTTGTPLFNLRPELGLGGENIEGFIMMWQISNPIWQPGDGADAAFTRLALGQENEH